MKNFAEKGGPFFDFGTASGVKPSMKSISKGRV